VGGDTNDGGGGAAITTAGSAKVPQAPQNFISGDMGVPHDRQTIPGGWAAGTEGTAAGTGTGTGAGTGGVTAAGG